MKIVPNLWKVLFSRSKYPFYRLKNCHGCSRPNGHVIYWFDVTLFAHFGKMAEGIGKAVQRGGRYCVAGAPNNQSCRNTSYTPRITMHQFPLDPKIRSQWLKFVQRHRVDFGEPINKYASLCSAHFEPSCYPVRLRLSLQGTEERSGIKFLLKDRFRRGPQFSQQLIKSQQIVEKDR